MVLETRSPEETFNVGKKLGEHAIPGQVFTLTGDLGVGENCLYAGAGKGTRDRGAGQQSDIYDRTGL